MTSTNPHSGVIPLSASDASKLLSDVIARAKAAGERGVLCFDLDSTLLNNRPRQSRILNEYGKEMGIKALEASTPDHWDGWDVKIPMRAVGLSHADAEQHEGPFKEFWWHRFFTSEYCEIDVPVDGAPAFVQTLAVETNARIVYLTGRHEAMRAGTVKSFETAGFPLPEDQRLQLWMKPTLDEHDDAFKDRCMKDLRALGTIVAAFDNEPMHINTYKEAFPEALSVHLATDCSPRDVRVLQGIPSISDFCRDTLSPATH